MLKSKVFRLQGLKVQGIKEGFLSLFVGALIGATSASFTTQANDCADRTHTIGNTVVQQTAMPSCTISVRPQGIDLKKATEQTLTFKTDGKKSPRFEGLDASGRIVIRDSAGSSVKIDPVTARSVSN